MTGRARSRRRVILGTIIATLAFAASGVSASSAAASSCTGTPHDAQSDTETPHEIDVTCDTAIVNGSITVRVNRGGDVAAQPTIVNGSGSLSCTGQQQAPGSQFQLVISCTGSMTAAATAQILASYGPNPCSSPAFSGDLSVAFGDGTTFGPTPLGAYDCSNGPPGGGGSPTPGHDFDPGGVFLGFPKKPPAKASVAKARTGLKFVAKLGVKGKVKVTIEVKGKSVGATRKSTGGGATKLTARLSSSGARKLAGHGTRAKIHVHVVPDASEGLNSTGEKYFKLKLTG
jgi:hypothetical protein